MYGNESQIQKIEKETSLKTHLNYDINQLRDNAKRVQINIHSEENKEKMREIEEITSKGELTRKENRRLWEITQSILIEKQKYEFPKKREAKYKIKSQRKRNARKKRN